MSFSLAALGTGLSIASNLFNTGYSIYQDQRDYNYKTDLQNQIFQREDNAIQRRVADLEAAGLNKNLAAGTGAGAGSVVSSSSAKVNSNIGGMLDLAAAQSQINAQKAQTENLKAQNKILEQGYRSAKSTADADAVKADLEKLKYMYMTGATGIHKEDGKWHGYYDSDDVNLDNSPLIKFWDLDLQNGQNSAKILETDAQWSEADKVINAARNVVPGLPSIKGGRK